MLSALFLLHSLRFAVPTAIMVGSAPQQFLALCTWRFLSAILPVRVYEKGDEILYDSYQSLVSFFFETYTGMKVIFYGDEIPHDRKENVIYLCNHQSQTDWVISDLIAIRQGSLGSIRYVLKDGLKYLPLYGVYFGMHKCVFVKKGRMKPVDMDVFGKQLENYKRDKTPVWLVIFPEGTRYNVENMKVIKSCQAFSRENGLPVFNHVLTPRTKAMEMSVDKLHDYIDAVYDVTIAYKPSNKPLLPRTQPHMVDILESSNQEVHIHINRICPEGVPKEREKIKQWLYKIFAKKDKLLSHFYSESENSGRFPGQGRHKSLSLLRTTPFFIFYVATLVPLLGTKWGRSLYWKTWVSGTIGGILYMMAFS